MAQYAVSVSGPLEDALLATADARGGISRVIREAVQAHLMPDHPELVKPTARRLMLLSTSPDTMRNIEKVAAQKGITPSMVARELLEEVFGE